MSNVTIEKEEMKAPAGAVAPAREERSSEDQLWHLKAKLRSEYPKGFYFIGNDGMAKNEPWMLVDIVEKTLTLPSGATHEGHAVRVRRMDGEGAVEEYPLGDFMEHRIIRAK